MSYVNMDHASWVARNIEGHKRMKATAREQRAAADNKGWHAAPDVMTPFHRRAFDILGIVGNGIYNAPIAWSGIVWYPRQIIVPWRNGLGTWDFMELTRLVFLCHQARIRGYIEPGAPRHLNIWLSERTHEGDIARRHPNLDEAVAEWLKEVPADHPIVYRLPETNSEAA